jgi:V/A-type H+-transporting ATPase subunit D
MSNSTVKPTRQEFLRLKKKTKTAEKGHKLLKDKRDGLIREFLVVVKDALRLRKELDQDLIKVMQFFQFAETRTSKKLLEEIAVTSEAKAFVTLARKNIMGVIVSEITADVKGNPLSYGIIETPKDIDEAIFTLQKIFPDLMKLAELEFTARRLAEEIEKTRRRVNALEHVLIPEMKNDMKYIKGKLDETTRQEKVTLMKMKELLDI